MPPVPHTPTFQGPVNAGADDSSRNFSDLIRILESDQRYAQLKQSGAPDDVLTARMQEVLRSVGEPDGVIRAVGVKNGEPVSTGGIPWKLLAVTFGAIATAGVVTALAASGAAASGAAGAADAAAGAGGAGTAAGAGAGAGAGIGGGSVANAGFWSGLANTAKDYAINKGKDFVKDPQAWGSVLSGVGDAMTVNREASNDRALTTDALRMRDAQNFEDAQQRRAQLLLEQQEGERRAQSDAFRKAIIGKYTANAGNAVFDRSKFNNVSDIHLNGGLQLSDINREAGSALESQAMRALLTPEKRPELAPIERTQPTPEKSGGFWENLISAGGLFGAASGLKKPAPVEDDGDQKIQPVR